MKKRNLIHFVFIICFISCLSVDTHNKGKDDYIFLGLGYYKFISDNLGVCLYNNNIFMLTDSNDYILLKEDNLFKILPRNPGSAGNLGVDSFRLDCLYVSVHDFDFINDTILINYDGVVTKIARQNVDFQSSFYMNDFQQLLQKDILYDSYIKAKNNGYSFQYLDYTYLLYDDYLYVIIDNWIDPEPFMLHFLMPDGSFINKDFNFDKIRIDNKFFHTNREKENKKISRIKIKINEKYYPIQIGEYQRDLLGKPILLWYKKIYPTKVLGNMVMRNTLINEN